MTARPAHISGRWFPPRVRREPRAGSSPTSRGCWGASEHYADDQELYWIFCFLDDTGAAESPQRPLGAVFRDEHEVAAMKAFGLVLDRALGRRDPGLWRAVSAAASDASRTLNSAVMS